jgi:hypothetical protein
VSWKDCGTAKNHVKVTNISWSPKVPEAGDNITITATGVLDEDMPDTTMTLTFANVFHHKFDGCKGATIKAPLNIAVIYFPPIPCPMKKGVVTSVRYVTVSTCFVFFCTEPMPLLD